MHYTCRGMCNVSSFRPAALDTQAPRLTSRRLAGVHSDIVVDCSSAESRAAGADFYLLQTFFLRTRRFRGQHLYRDRAEYDAKAREFCSKYAM